AALRLLRHRRGELGAHDHAVGAHGGARGGRLGLALYVHQALPAGADGLQQRVVAEPRDLDAELLGGPDDQRALGHGDLEAVDGDRHAVSRLGNCHHAGSIVNSAERAGSNGQPPIRRCSRYSSRKNLIEDTMGAWIESPRAQNARPVMLSQMSISFARSDSLPVPSSSCSRIWTTQ